MGVPRGGQQPGRGALARSLASKNTVLVYSPSIGGLPSSAAVPAFLDESTELSDATLAAVTYRQSADEWLDSWHRNVGDLPNQCVVVGVGDNERSAAATAGNAGAADANGPGTGTTGTGQPGSAAAPYSIRAVHPEDLTGLGIAINEPLSNASASGRQSVLTFDSVTALLQYVDTQRTFRFLHVLTSRVRAADALGIFFIDPAAHDDRTVRTIDALFDAIVERNDDGDWVVRDA